MRPNIAQDAPPTVIPVGGSSYNIETDYRVWIDVLSRMETLNATPETEEEAQNTLEKIYDIERLIFGRKIKENIGDVMKAISDFSAGYPMAPVRGRDSGAPTYDLELDINAIVIAIRNQSGIDISYRCKHFHWWLFLLEFHTLCGEHYIMKLMEARGYRGKDKDLQRRRDDCALPRKITDKEMEEYRATEALFNGE